LERKNLKRNLRGGSWEKKVHKFGGFGKKSPTKRKGGFRNTPGPLTLETGKRRKSY